MADRKRIKLKYCLTGAESVGKTSFVKRLDSKPFEEEYNPTDGVELIVYQSNFDGHDIKYQLWDGSGKESYNSLVKEFCKTSNGILAFYDITNKDSFEFLKSKIDSLKFFLNENASILIIGNKNDLEEQRQVTQEEAESYANDSKYLFCEISVKNSFNSINEALNKISEDSIRKIDMFDTECFTNRSMTLSLPKLTCESTMSTARSQRIDAMSNSVLISSCNVYNRLNEVESRKFIADLIDQIKMLKTDVEKKDRLIQKLSNMREPKSNRHEESSEFERFLSIERNAFNTVKKEIETKYELVSNQLAEEKARVSMKEETIVHLKHEIDTLKSEILQLKDLNEEKNTKLTKLEANLASFENIDTKSEITITTLQTDNKELQSKILELESNIRRIQCEKEEVETMLKTSNIRIKSITEYFDSSSNETFETVMLKLKELKTENLINKGKLNEITDKYNYIETENNLNKQTVLNLKSDIRNLEQTILDYKIQIEELKAHKESAESSKEIVEKEMENLKEKIINTQQVWLTTTKELEDKEQKCTQFVSMVKNLESNSSKEANDFVSFLEEIALLLSDGYFKVEANKNEIKEKIKLLMFSSKHRGLVIASLEEKNQSLNEQVKNEVDEKTDLKFHLQATQGVVRNLEDKIFDLEAKITEQSTLNQTLSFEREKVTKVLESLANTYELPTEMLTNSIPTIDKILEIILYKIENKRRPVEKVSASRSHLEAKIVSLTEQLNNKDIHLELLRKKVTDLEEEKFGRSEIRTEYENLIKTNKKLNIKIERLTEELTSFKSENSQIKSHLLDVNGLKFEVMTKDTEIEKLKLRIVELESSNDSHMIRIGGLKEEIDSTKSHLETTVKTSDSSIKALSSELRGLKIEYDKTKSREHQLLDFRNVVAKKVGLEVNSLRVPDYEIIARIEFFVNDRVHLITHYPAVINNIPTF